MKKQSVEYVTDQLTICMADLAWSFRTDQGQGLLFMAEFQSTADAWLALRQYTYAFCHLLAGVESQQYTRAQGQGLPLPILVSLYTGMAPWQARPLAELFAPPLDQGFPFPWFHYDMHRMEPTEIPSWPLLRTLFDLERASVSSTPRMAEILRHFHAIDRDPDLRSALIAFAAATLSHWDFRIGSDGLPVNIDVEWEEIITLEELAMVEDMLQTRLNTWIAEGEAKGEARGEARGEAKGEVKGRRDSLLELAASVLEAQDVEVCRAGLEGKALDEMPSISDLFQVIQTAGDRHTAVLALLKPDAFAAQQD